MSIIYITLNDVEQASVKYVAKKRIAYDLQIGAGATVYGDKTLEELHIGSYGAELAFCKMHNIYPDLNYMERRDEDCVTAVGHRIDVKWNAREDGWLSAKVKPRNNPPDSFALMIGESPRYRLAGYIPAAELLKEDRINKNLTHPAYIARQVWIRSVTC